MSDSKLGESETYTQEEMDAVLLAIRAYLKGPWNAGTDIFDSAARAADRYEATGAEIIAESKFLGDLVSDPTKIKGLAYAFARRSMPGTIGELEKKCSDAAHSAAVAWKKHVNPLKPLELTAIYKSLVDQRIFWLFYSMWCLALDVKTHMTSNEAKMIEYVQTDKLAFAEFVKAQEANREFDRARENGVDSAFAIEGPREPEDVKEPLPQPAAAPAFGDGGDIAIDVVEGDDGPADMDLSIDAAPLRRSDRLRKRAPPRRSERNAKRKKLYR
jgi:hypothetical protein